MNNHMIKIGTVVPRLKVADVNYNVEEIKKTLKDHQDTSILVYPELCITGYTCADLFEQSLLLSQSEQAVIDLVEESVKYPQTCIVVGFPLCIDNSLYNVAGFISNGKLHGIVPKSYIPTYSEFYEDRWFTSGKEIKNKVIYYANEDVPFGVDLLFKDKKSLAVVGIEICEDLWVPDKPSTHASLRGANIILNLSASDELIGKEEFRRNMVMQQSAGCYVAYAYVSSGMDESSTDLVFSGHSIISDCGQIVKESIFDNENHVETAIINLDKIIYNRMHQNTFETRISDYRFIDVNIPAVNNKNTISSSELVEVLKKEQVYVNRFPFVPSNESERENRCKRILQIQANGLATRVKATGIKTLVIGISGGLDSTLALLVCHEAKKLVPDIRVIGYTLPNKGNTTSLTYNNALKLMKTLGVEAREVAIEKGVESHLIDIGHGGKYRGEGDTTYENAQARMRTYILMDAANYENGLVVGTGDLSELALGWCTYNGDHMSMYGVNASVPKTLVQYICSTYAYTCNNDDLKEVLLSIVNTPISPELTPNKEGQIAQKTEEKIGKYDLNDFFLYYVLRYGMNPEELIAYALTAYSELSIDTVKDALIRFYSRFFTQQFKRSCLPDGPKVGSVTLSPRGDWRMPSDASRNLWLEKVRNAE